MDRQLAAMSGLAILLVLLNHAISQGILGAQDLGYPLVEGLGYYLLLVLSELGILAVPVFLFTSGSFISYAARRNPPKLPWKNVWATSKRILWPYLFWSSVFFIFIYFRKNEEYNLFGYLRNLVVGRPFHFIPILMFYYVASPLLVWLADRFGLVLLVVIGLYQLLLADLVLPANLGLNFPNWMQILVPPALGTTMAMWGIYFPLGLVYGLKAQKVRPWLQKFRVLILIITTVCFALHVLHEASVLRFPLTYFASPFTFLLLVPSIKRNSIPMVGHLEKVARKVYGLYLTHLIVLDIVFYSVQLLVPWLLTHQIMLSVFLFFAALGVPLVVMNSAARIPPTRTIYRYVFG
jgi:peptidoglycan/LPS O-acetylase OafA/YrhL